MRDNFYYAWKEIRSQKAKSFWKITSYFLLFIFFLLIISLSNATKDQVETSLETTGAQFASFILSSENKNSNTVLNPLDEGFYLHNNATLLFDVSLIENIKSSRNVADASPYLSFRYLFRAQNKRVIVIGGLNPEANEAVLLSACSSSDIVSGRLLHASDNNKVLLEETFARSENLQVGDRLKLDQTNFDVVGILTPGTRPAKADVYMTLENASMIINTRIKEPLDGKVNVVLVDGSSSLDNQQAIVDTKAILGVNSSTIGFGCYNPAGKAILTAREGNQLVYILIILSLLAMIFVLQYLSVIERKKIISILKVIGWSDKNIIIQTFIEIMILAFVGGFFGIMFLFLQIMLIPSFIISFFNLNWNYIFQWQTILVGFFTIFMSGFLAGLICLYVILRIRPAELLRRI